MDWIFLKKMFFEKKLKTFKAIEDSDECKNLITR